MMRSFVPAVLLVLLSITNADAQRGWRMEGFDSSRTNVIRTAGPLAAPAFEVIASNVSGALKRIADDGSLIVADRAGVSSFDNRGRLRWRADVQSMLSGEVKDVALDAAGTIYVSSATSLIALEPMTGRPAWRTIYVANNGDESSPLAIASDGTVYFHTGGSRGVEERLVAITQQGTTKWAYTGNAGRGTGRVVLNSDESTVYLYQLRPDGSGKAIGLAARSGERIYDTLCDVSGALYAYTQDTALLTGAAGSSLLKSPSMLQSCAVLSSGSNVTGVAAAPNSSLLIVETSLAGNGSSYAGLDLEGRIVWSRVEPLTGGFAAAFGESAGTFYAIAPQSNEVVAIRIATGEELWRQRFNAPLSGMLLSGNRNLYLVAGNQLLRGEPSPADSPRVQDIISASTKAAPGSIHSHSSAGSSSRLPDSMMSLLGGGPSPILALAFHEGSGTTAADLSGNSFNGTLANGAGWTAAGRYGSAINLDGVNDKVSLPSAVDVAALPLTFEAWVNPASFAHWGAIFSKRSAASAAQMRFDVGLSLASGRVYVYTAASFNVFDYAPPLNTWTHLAVVADSTGTRLYVNGNQQAAFGVIALGSSATAAVNIGGTGDNDDPFHGAIDDLRLYNAALSVTDIQTDMNTPIPTGPPLLDITVPAAGSTLFSSTVSVNYTATGDMTEVNHVHFQLDSNPVVMDMTFDGVYQFTNVPVGPHTLSGFLVRADHSKINGSDDSVTFTTSLPDSTPPTVSMTAPADGATVTGTVGLTASASDNSGIAGVQFLVDGAVFGAEDTSAPYSITWNTSGLVNGLHTLAARARDLAGNLATSTSRTVTVSNLDPNSPAIVGQWSAPMAWPIVSIHLTLLPTGKVLAWDNSFSTAAAVRLWDPVTGAFTDASVPLNIFCTGQTLLPDGRIIVLGGHIDYDIGTKDVSVYDPFLQTWSTLPQMAFARWYAGATTLGDGRVLAQLGTTTCKSCIAGTPEIYNPATNSWQQLTNAASPYTLYYPHTFPLPNGKVFVAGASQYAVKSRVLDLSNQTWTIVDNNTSEGGFYAMYAPGKIMRAGGPWDDGFGFPTAATAVIDMNAATPTWRSTAPMAIPRVLNYLTILPDGSVLSTGGSSDAATLPPAGAIAYAAELWNPDSESWSTMASMQTARLYHATSLLLPDGRVLVSGSGRAFTTDQFNAEIYSPPYLFKGPRPTITSAPSQASYGSSMFVATPNGAQITKVSLVALGAVTHTTNFNQKYVPLTFSTTAGGLNVTLPANGNYAPPGYYMLFVVDSNGVPSVASFIHVDGNGPDTTAPTAPTNLTANAASGPVNLSWTASTDNIGVSAYRVERCQGAGCSNFAQIGTTATTSYSDTSVTAGTSYSYRVRAGDAAGNLSGYSNTASVTTPTPDVLAPTNPSGLTATAPSSSQINLSWTASTDNVAVTGYRIERCQGAGCSTFAQIGTSTATSYSDTGLSGSTSYSYRVRANDGAGNLSGYSNVASATTASTPPSTGLLAAFGFNEGTGTTTADASGNGYTGTLANGATWIAGNTANAVSFDGVDDRVSLASTLDVPALPLTVEAWVRPTSFAQWRAIFSKRASYTPSGIRFDVGLQSGNGRVYFTTYSSLLIFTYAPPLNTWTHLAVTADSTGTRLYANGVLQQTLAAVTLGTGATAPVSIGRAGDGDDPFAGGIDDFRLYTRSLTAGEIVTDMNSPVSAAPAPTAPGSLTATLSGTSQINLAWTASTSTVGILNYAIERCQGGGCSNFTALATATTTSYSDAGLSAGTSYSYRVRAVDVNNTPGAYSNTATAATPDTAAPTAPASLAATAPAATQVNLTWTASTDNVGVTGYQVERCTGAGCTTFAQIGTIATAAYTDNAGLTAGGTYRYRVRATDAAGNLSGYSNIATATTPAPDVTAPTNPSALNAAPSGSAQIDLTWTASTDNVAVTGYRLERCQGAGCSTYAQIATPTGTSYSDTGLAAATSYSYRLRAADAAGNLSGYSNVASATTGNAQPSTGLIAAFGFNEGAGTTTADASPNAYTGTLGGGAAWTAGNSGGAVAFDGVDDRVLLPSTVDVAALPMTVEAWIRPTSVAQWRAIFSKRSSYTPAGMRFDVGLQSATGRMYLTTYSSLLIFAYAPPLNTWTHVALVADATGTRLYANGVLQETQAAVTLGTGSTATVSIGRAGDGDDPFAGAIDDVRLYSRGLTAGEIVTDMNTPVTSTPDTTAPTAPSGLAGSAASATQINLTWTASTDNIAVTGYNIERCQGAGCSTFAAAGTSTTPSFTDTTGLAAGASYNYRVRARDAANNLSGFSNVATVVTPAPDLTPPGAPSGLGATAASSSQINLTWTAATDNVGVTGYRLERCQGAGCSSFAQIATPAGTSYSDTGLAASTSFSYRVRATDAAGNLGAYSNVASATTQAAGPSTGLIASYSFNEGTGTTTADRSGNSNTGTLAGGAAWAAGNTGNAVTFDGVDDRVSLPSTLDVAAVPLTIEAWIRPTSFAQWRAIFSKRSSYSAAGIRFDVGLQTGSGRVYFTTYSSLLSFTYAPPLNTWTHLAVVADATGTRLYINGVLQQTLAAVTLGTGAGAPVSIGRAGDGDDPFAGAIDDLRLYGRALTQAEVQADMANPVTP